MRELLDCPHCFGRILPMTDGRCPQCRNDTNARTREAAEMTVVSIDKESIVPDVCAGCGLPTYRRVTFKRKKHDPTDDDFTMFQFLMFGCVGAIGLLLSGLFRGNRGLSIRVKLPHCLECHTRKPLEPHSVSFEELQMRFVVHREFARQFAAVNGD